jgi:hypothetical protein
VPEPYRSPDWALVPAKTGPEGLNTNNNKYGLFRVNNFIETCFQFSMGVEIQLFECYARKTHYEMYEGKTNDLLIAFIG